MTLLLILMKYNWYMSFFIGLVHIFMLYIRSLYWLMHDNCIVDTLPDAYFACYRLADDDGKCTNCNWHWLFQVWISFLLVSCRVICKFEFLSISTYLLHLWASQFAVLYKLPQFPRLQLGTHMPVVVKTCSFITATLVSKY